MNKMQIIGLGVAVVAFGGAFFFFSMQSPPPPPRGPAQVIVKEAPKVDVDQVLVALQYIPMGTKITEQLVGWQEWPRGAVSELMIAKSTDPKAIDDFKDSLNRVELLRGEPIRRDKLVKAGQGGFMSAVLPTGMRAVAIKIDNSGESTAGGFILPNDRVDVVRIFRDDEATKARGVEMVSVQTILTDVKVLAIGQTFQDDNGKKVAVGANATLELTPKQSEQVVLAQHASGGTLHLLLRSLVDSGGKAEMVTDLGAGGRGLTIMRYGAAQQAAR